MPFQPLYKEFKCGFIPLCVTLCHSRTREKKSATFYRPLRGLVSFFVRIRNAAVNAADSAPGQLCQGVAIGCRSEPTPAIISALCSYRQQVINGNKNYDNRVIWLYPFNNFAPYAAAGVQHTTLTAPSLLAPCHWKVWIDEHPRLLCWPWAERRISAPPTPGVADASQYETSVILRIQTFLLIRRML